MLKLISNIDSKKALYECECGKIISLWKSNVSSGHTKSCGCLRAKASRERLVTHGHKSGGKRTKTYAAWCNMKGRCNNPARPDTKNYWGRGIKYCPEWEVFENFLADMGEAPIKGTLDRTDNSKGYSKDNCRWVTMKVQSTNKRNNVFYTWDGKTMTLADWSRETGIERSTLHLRIKRGVPLNLAFTVKGYLKINR